MRVLIIAEAANPEWVSVPLVGFKQADAIRRAADALIVTQVRNRDALIRCGWQEGIDFLAIDSEAIARPMHRLASLGGQAKGGSLATGLGSIAQIYFEQLVWKKLRNRLSRGEFNAVHRITPVSPSCPSPLAKRCAKLGIPFLLGPINGGVPWPKGYLRERTRERELWSLFQPLRRLLPGQSAMLKYADRIFVGSNAAINRVPTWAREKCVIIPENGIDAAQHLPPRSRVRSLPLQLAFVGRLVPCKGVHLAIQGLAPLLRNGLVRMSIFGDGPERRYLETLSLKLGTRDYIKFRGWCRQAEIFEALREHDVFVFPSIREFGGGALLEAMACGLPPIFINYGGPPDIAAGVGESVSMGTPEQVRSGLAQACRSFVADPDTINKSAHAAHQRAIELTWDSKAEWFREQYRQACSGR